MMFKNLLALFDKKNIFFIFGALAFFIFSSMLYSSMPIAFKYIIDNVNSSNATVLMLIILYSAVFLLSDISSNFKLITYIFFEQKVQKQLILYVLEKCYRTSFKQMMLNRADEYAIMIDRGVSGLRGFLYGFFFSVLPTIIQLLFFIVIYAKHVQWWNSIVVAILIACFILYAIKFSQIMKKKWEHGWEIATTNYGVLQETIYNLETIRNYNATNWSTHRYANCQDNFINNIFKMIPVIAKGGIIQSMLLVTIVGIVTGFSIMKFKAGGLTAGDTFMINALMLQMIIALQTFSASYQGLLTNLASFKQLDGIIKKGTSSINLPLHYHTENSVALVADGINFSINNHQLLNNVSLTIFRKTLVGIVGESGSGKTILGKVLAGLLEYDGSITYAHDAKIAYLNQNVEIFDLDIFSNVSLSIETNRELAYAALLQAGFDNTTLDTIGMRNLGLNGKYLSGGQRQRLGIARMLYHDANIFIFDEPTSALDPQTTEKVLETIYMLADRYTVILISHRIQDLKSAQHVIRIEKGAIIA